MGGGGRGDEDQEVGATDTSFPGKEEIKFRLSIEPCQMSSALQSVSAAATKCLRPGHLGRVEVYQAHSDRTEKAKSMATASLWHLVWVFSPQHNVAQVLLVSTLMPSGSPVLLTLFNPS